ncbi:precorrin-3B synthase [Aquabacter spiritensis]|uniref:Precorrin-3B synthase n=1 Tax=Aquabacter spiritensis TaxID=933073 RepID=A0A4V2UYR3_9HYPH|nr:precorrin-3B synthase [Aquabacter spiritensis]TCT08118.1 precorrin-3B synthase [Aquabacter spiritensis]
MSAGRVEHRRGACPTLAAPMETGDGLLVRLTPKDGALTPTALAGLARAAAAFGNGILEVTARGNLQVRGLRRETLPAFSDAVDHFGIELREGLVIDLSPLSGLDPAEQGDARAMAEHVRAAVAAAGISAGLGPKVSVVISDAGAVPLDALKADLRLSAQGGGAWEVSLAGDSVQATRLGRTDAAGAAACAVDLLARIAARGRRARMADVLGDGLLSAGNLPRLDPLPAQAKSAARGLISDAARPAEIPLTDGTRALRLYLPFGVADAGMIAALCQAAADGGVRDLRPAPPRALIAVGLAAAAIGEFAAAVARLGFILDPADPRRAVSACPGAPACASGHIPARALAPQVAELLAPLLDGSVHVHVSGCAKGCAHPAPADLVIAGREARADGSSGGMDSAVVLVRHGTAAESGRVLALRDLLPALARLPVAAGGTGSERLARLDLAELPFAALET